jgi:hypothetical protein
MRYMCAVLALAMMGAVPYFPQMSWHTTLVCEHDGSLSDDGFSSCTYEYMTPDLAAYTYTIGNGQEFRLHRGTVWLLTRSCIREWVYAESPGNYTLNVQALAKRDGNVPPSAYATCQVAAARYGREPSDIIWSETFGLAGEMPEVYGRQIAITGPGWFVVTISTESVMPRDLWPDDVRYPFAVRLHVHAWVE